VNAKRAVGDHRDHVEHYAVGVEVLEVLAEPGPAPGHVTGPEEGRVAIQFGAGARVDRCRRVTAIPRHERRDPLGGERREHLAVGIVRDHEVAVGVNIDEPRGNRHRRCIDDGRRGRVVGNPADRRDRSVSDPDIGRERRIAGPVDDAPVPDQDIEQRGLHHQVLGSEALAQKPGFWAR
jgi:hypothetical protein